ncbi:MULTISPECIES: AI-2E family transporter [unclassified Methylobacterium]|uniref:AI-2E family transporter n=1 Tax=unclassified Methylobacterium TaxID=2615210 RepID=UPI0006F97417|nr:MULTISPECIES: AI-2E family transporter [unclassified Methylobacterium]KQP77683.1 transporter [Methylobacterium sp. Leaf113]KQP83208.1 transporter [Methylobacterium sp. Leaf117]MCK2053849.1 AI-2E family transporter [Methylobacterium sp. 37f]
MAIPFLRPDSAGPRPQSWSPAVSGIAVVAFVAVLALAWMAASTLLLVFAGILLGVFLDGLTRLLGQVLPASRGLRLSLVSLVLAGLTLALIAFGGATIVQQGRDLGQTVAAQAGTVRDRLKEYGIDVPQIAPGKGSGDAKASDVKAGDLKADGGDKAAGDSEAPEEADAGAPDRKPGGLAGLASGAMKSPGSLLSDAGSVLGPAATVVIGLFNALGNALVIVFLGLSVAADPGAYRDGLVRFVPPAHRERATALLDGMGETLRHWLFGQLITMAVIFVCTWAGLAFLGIGGALILGLQAGLLAFIPTIGPLIAGVVILLASLASGTTALFGALGVYLAVQTLESYGLTPFIQKQALDIPPATIFAGQLVLGVIFGLWGIALALPLMAVAKVLLAQLYIEDTLHEEAEA